MTPTSDATTFKCLINSVLSTNNAKFTGIDIKESYLKNPLKRFEYTEFLYDIIPEEINIQYNLAELNHSDGYFHIKIRKGMYILTQEGCIENYQV